MPMWYYEGEARETEPVGYSLMYLMRANYIGRWYLQFDAITAWVLTYMWHGGVANYELNVFIARRKFVLTPNI